MSTPQLALILASVSTPEQAADEKQSLDSQERDLRAIAAENGWKVLDVLRVPGFSRDYISWEDCAQDMLKRGITAFTDLKRYCEQNAFDVFMVRDADRFGRTQSLVMQIAETIGMKLGKNIYSQMNGLIKPDSCRMWAMMAGYTAAADMDKRRIYREMGMDKRAQLGLHEATTPWFHRTVRDPANGKPLYVEIREEFRYIWDRVFQLVVEERIGFGNIERILAGDFQIMHPLTGQPFSRMHFYNLLCANTVIWGHRTRNEKTYVRQHGHLPKYGEWVYNPDVPPPEGINLYYNVFPPIYTGEQAASMIAELRRRADMKGGRKPNKTAAFSGLVICDYCGAHMAHMHMHKRGWRAFRCLSNGRWNKTTLRCDSKVRSIHYADLEQWMDAFLSRLLAGEALEAAFPLSDGLSLDEITLVEQQLEQVKGESSRLIERIGLIPDALLPDYQMRMQTVADRAAFLQTRLDQLHQQQQSHNRDEQTATLHDLQTLGLADFWALPESRQHQLLKRLFGNWRIVVADGIVVGVANITTLKTS